MKGRYLLLGLPLLLIPTTVYAATPGDITSFTTSTLSIITLIAIAASGFFLVRGGYTYITSTGKPEALEQAKQTIRNAILGLVVVLAAGVMVSTLQGALNPVTDQPTETGVALNQITAVKPSDGLTQVLLDAVSGFLQNIVESGTKPIINGIITFLTTTPSLLQNSVVKNFWLVSVGIVDSLFILVIALIGLQVMSATTFGFEELELKQILPRIGLAFLGANVSLFLADYVVLSCNVLIKTVLDATGGLHQAWFVNTANPVSIATGATPIILLAFLLIFLIVSIVLLFMYIGRLILISLGAVLSPFIFLMWGFPKFADMAEMAARTYVANVFIIFIHVVVIQLASSYLTLPGNSNNSLLSIAVGIGLLLTLLKIPSILMYLVFTSFRSGSIRKIGYQILNVITSPSGNKNQPVKSPRKVVHA